VSGRRALFLDRDGVIHTDCGYLYRQQDVVFTPGIFDLARAARQRDYALFIVTNQAGIGRGYYTEQDFHRLMDWMCGVFATESAAIKRVYFCPSHPEHGLGPYKIESPFRKPAPGMILQAAREFGVEIPRSLLIGDKLTDIEAGIAAGVGCNVLFRASGTEHVPASTPCVLVNRLCDAIEFLQ